jgi:hypothetical protein
VLPAVDGASITLNRGNTKPLFCQYDVVMPCGGADLAWPPARLLAKQNYITECGASMELFRRHRNM